MWDSNEASYKFDKVEPVEQSKIREAMDIVERNTYIRFKVMKTIKMVKMMMMPMKMVKIMMMTMKMVKMMKMLMIMKMMIIMNMLMIMKMMKRMKIKTQHSVTYILNIALPSRDGCDKF